MIEDLKKLRAGKKISQAEMGRLLDLSKGNICDIEKGRRNITIKTLEQYAETCGYDELEIICRSSTLPQNKKRVVLKLINEEEQENG